MEELIWLSALCELEAVDRDRVMRALIVIGAQDDVKAQASFSGPEYDRSAGLDRIARDLKVGQNDARADVKRILASIGLDVGRRTTPSVRAVAERAGRLEIYDFLYHASSTAVHFRPDQITRGIWGTPELMRFDLQRPERARSAFGLFWCLWLARETLRTALPLCGDVELPEPALDALLRVEALLSKGGYPQFIYGAEFNRRTGA